MVLDDFLLQTTDANWKITIIKEAASLIYKVSQSNHRVIPRGTSSNLVTLCFSVVFFLSSRLFVPPTSFQLLHGTHPSIFSFSPSPPPSLSACKHHSFFQSNSSD